ncbi:hypothetical protein [Intestinibacillus massiliensis]|nr:hypothetical protein [Intestinibacillus massiliensis]
MGKQQVDTPPAVRIRTGGSTPAAVKLAVVRAQAEIEKRRGGA